MNTNWLDSRYENPKVLHKNNLSSESVKFLAKDFLEAWNYGEKSPTHTSVQYKIATEEGFGYAKYIKVGQNSWKHQESNVSAEVGYAISDAPNISEMDGKYYLDGYKELEIFEIEFFPPAEEKISENSDDEKNKNIAEILAKMSQFGIKISDIIGFQNEEKTKIQDENEETKVQEEIDSIKKMGENLRAKRKNGNFIPSNEEMLRREKFIKNARIKNQETAENEEKNFENFDREMIDIFIKNHIDYLWEEIVAARKMLSDSQDEWKKLSPYGAKKNRKGFLDSWDEREKNLSSTAYENIEESIEKMLESRKKLQGILNKNLSDSEMQKLYDFSQSIAKITENEEKLREESNRLNNKILLTYIKITQKNEKLNALQNPKNLKEQAQSLWEKMKTFITRKPNEIDTLVAEIERLEEELEDSQNALNLISNSQKQIKQERNQIINDFVNSL